MRDFVRLKWIILVLILQKSSLKSTKVQEYDILGSTQVIRCFPNSRTELLFLNSLRKNLNYDFWLAPREVAMPVDIMAEGKSLLELKLTLKTHNIKHEIFMDDVPSAIRSNVEANQRGLLDGNFFQAYHNYDEILKWMKNFGEKNANAISHIYVGKTYERRNMYVTKISKSRRSSLIKPALWIDGGIHGREWIAPAVVLYMLNELVTNRTYSSLLDQMDFYFMPVANPDGYDFTFQDGGRLWRKTRSWKPSAGLCRGVDVNRNWDFHWNGTGDQCSENYAGPAPFSEQEMVQTREAIMNNILHLRGYLSYHSYAQLFLFPWGYTTDRIEDFEELAKISGQAVDEIYTYSGTRYKQQPYCVDPGLCINGDSIDYLKGVGKLKYTFVIQLPDLGLNGYLLPPSEIVPIGEESLRGLLVVAKAVINGN